MRLGWFLILVSLAARAEDPLSRGKAIFLDRCSLCHGPNGDGKGELAADLPLRPRNFRGEPLEWGNALSSVVSTVTHGRSDVMPAFEEVLTPEEIADVAAWVWSIIPAELKRRDFSPGPHGSPTSRVLFVRQRSNGFVPSRLTARVGDMIVFINDDHVEHELQKAEKSAVINVQKPFQWDRVVLSAPGTQRFECVSHGARFEVEVTP